MDVTTFYRRFRQIEEELDLFKMACAIESPWWDVVRYDVMMKVYARVFGTYDGTAPALPFSVRVINKIIRLLLRVQLELRIRSRHHDVIVYRAPRITRGGRRVDIAMDQVLDVCPGKPLVIDTFPHRFDRRFAAADQVKVRPAILGAVEQRVLEEFAVSVDLDHLVRHALADHEVAVKHYRRLLGRVQPRLLLITGVDKALFRAAREAGVTCIEVQHGLIHNAHPAYSYPTSLSSLGKAFVPDGLLTFSDFWLRNCYYPVRWSAAVGNDEFVSPVVGISASNNEVLIITSPSYNSRLCEYLDVIAPKLSDRNFKFKLHPIQSASKSEIESRLCHLPNVEVVRTDMTMAQALATASDVVLIQSTAAYEAVQAGRRLLVIREFDSGAHADLFDLPNVYTVIDVDGLQDVLTCAPRVIAPPVFFQPFNASLTRAILTQGGPLTERVAVNADDEEIRP
jgi:hypothetical protein